MQSKRECSFQCRIHEIDEFFFFRFENFNSYGKLHLLYKFYELNRLSIIYKLKGIYNDNEYLFHEFHNLNKFYNLYKQNIDEEILIHYDIQLNIIFY